MGKGRAAETTDDVTAGPSTAPFRNLLPLPYANLPGPGLSPKEAMANSTARVVEQLSITGNPLPTLHELTIEDRDTHLEEERCCVAMSLDSWTIWQDVLEIGYYMNSEHLAGLPSGYFHPSMPKNRQTQLAALVPKSAPIPIRTPTPGPTGTQPTSHYD